MRFDLEIPPYNTELIFFEEDEVNLLPDNAVPISYVNVDKSMLIPSDMVSIEEKYNIKNFSIDGYEKFNGTFFTVESDKFILTDIVRYSFKTDTLTPLFYKHAILNEASVSSVKIVDYFNNIIPKEAYVVEESHVYMNKDEYDEVLFIEYTTTNGIAVKELLNLIPVYEEINWDNYVAQDGQLDRHQYFLSNFEVTTSFEGTLYLLYLSNIALAQKPKGNIEDPWNINILNVNFKKNYYTFRTPEFYTQSFDLDGYINFIEHKICRKIHSDVVKSQYNIESTMNDSVFVYVENTYTKAIRYAYTSNPGLVKTEYKSGIIYQFLDTFTNDGLVYLPIKLQTTDSVYISHYTKENYYKYTDIDFSQDLLDEYSYCAFYITSNPMLYGIGHVLIGSNFDIKTIEEYMIFLNNTRSFPKYHVTLVALKANSTGLNLIDITSEGYRLKNKLEGLKSNQDLLLEDINRTDLKIPVDDTYLIRINASRLKQEQVIGTDTKEQVSADTNNYIELVKKALDTTLSTKTKTIIQLEG